MKVLVVEDEAGLRENIHAYLVNSEILCETAGTYAEAEDKLHMYEYDIIVLDIMLPDGSGLDLLRVFRNAHPDTGVLIISAKNALNDKITGLELGADDYLTKPFHLSELNARLKAIYRRRKFQGRSKIEFGQISVDTETLEVRVGEEQIVLTVKEYELLLFFLSNKNRVLTKQSIAEHLWGDHVDFLDSFDFVYQHIKNLRKKLLKAGDADYIKTIYGMGYKLTLS